MGPLKAVIVLFIPIIVTGCTPVYAPNIRNTPYFKKAGEVQGQIYYDPIQSFNSDAFTGTNVDVQAAVSLTDHIAFIGNYTQSSVPRDHYNLKRSYKELGGGYYRMFNKRFGADFFAGYGRGIVDGRDLFHSLQYDNYPLRLYYDKYFIQGVFLLKGKFFVFSPSMRLGYVTFNKYEKLGVQHSFNQSGNLFIEPCGTFQLNGRESKNIILSHGYILAQVGLNVSCNHFFEGQYKFKYEYAYPMLNTSVGVGLRIGPISKR
jgi:hypothetical protein